LCCGFLLEPLVRPPSSLPGFLSASFFSTSYSRGFTSAIPSLSLGLSTSFEKSSSLACGGGLLLVLQVCSCAAKLTRLSATDFKSFLRW
jgi:hypothetical protein